LLFGVEPLDLPTIAASAAMLVGVALAAAWVPARRAMAVEPMVALRRE
jgi:putative ABC transport system permease protein